MKIPGSIENWIVDDMTPRQVRHVKPVLPADASGRVADIYAQIRRDFQLVPPLTLFSPVPGLLAGVWSIWRESQFAVGKVPRPITEAVAAAISSINNCSYCVDAHTGMLHASSDHEVVEGILGDRNEAITDPRMRKIVEWALATRTPDSELLRNPPFTREEAPEIIGTAVTYHFVNRMVTIFLSPTPMPVPGGAKGLRRMAARVFGATVGRGIVARAPGPGESLHFVATSTAPSDLAWAAPNANIGGAFAGCTEIIESEGDKAAPEPVRAVLDRELQEWRGESKGLSRHWLEQALNGISAQHKPAAQLALLSALAPHQVDDEIIRTFRIIQPSDRDLLGLTAWASFAAARRISSWLLTH